MKIENASIGLEVHRHSVSLVSVTLTGVTGRGALSLQGEGPYSLERCTLSHNKVALTIDTHAALHISNCTIEFNTNVMTLNKFRTLVVQNSHFRMNGAGMRIYSDNGATLASVLNCTFYANGYALLADHYGNMSVTFTGNTINGSYPYSTSNPNPALRLSNFVRNGPKDWISNNQFLHLESDAIAITTRGYIYTSDIEIVIQENIFREVAGYSVNIDRSYYNYLSILIRNNTFEENGALADKKGTVYVDARHVVIDLNQFTSNKGSHVVYVKHSIYNTRDTDVGNVSISSNVFYQNQVDTAVVHVSGTSDCQITYNIFSGSQTRYDVQGDFNSGTIDATNNWWGSTDEIAIGARIFDVNDRPSSSPQGGEVLFRPYLLKPEFSCDEVGNCSGHGACVRPQTCECVAGWMGHDCSLLSCAQRSQCGGDHGQCVGPNQCECGPGWQLPDCTRATCYGKDNCTNQGVCIAPDT